MNNFLKTLSISVVAVFGFLVTSVCAEVPTYKDPSKMMEAVADKTFTRIVADQALIQKDLEHLRVIVNEELLPYIDARYSSLRVVGKAVQQTSESERVAFIKAFTDYMVGTYAGALTQYKNQSVIIEPVKVNPGQKIISIKTRFVDPGKPDINLVFKLRRAKEDANWLVFDLVAEGISLLDSKGAELAPLIRQQGVAKVTALLQEKAKAPITPLIESNNAKG